MVTCLLFAMTIAMVNCGGLAFDETCADLQFEGFTNGDTFRLEQYFYVSVTFHLDTSKCPDSGDSFRLKVSVNEGEGSEDVCILFMKTQDCSPSDESICQCLSAPTGWARMSRHLNMTGQVSIIWRWFNQGSSSSQWDANITFNVIKRETSVFKGNGDLNTEETTNVFQSDASRR